jgi:hypothetical protein
MECKCTIYLSIIAMNIKIIKTVLLVMILNLVILFQSSAQTNVVRGAQVVTGVLYPRGGINLNLLGGTNFFGTSYFTNPIVIGTITGNGSGLTSISATNLIDRAVFTATIDNGVMIDATKASQFFVTNDNVTILGYSGVVAGKRYYPTMLYSNSAAGDMIFAGPAGATYTLGSTNQLHIPGGKMGWLLTAIGEWGTNITTLLCQ